MCYFLSKWETLLKEVHVVRMCYYLQQLSTCVTLLKQENNPRRDLNRSLTSRWRFSCWSELCTGHVAEKQTWLLPRVYLVEYSWDVYAFFNESALICPERITWLTCRRRKSFRNPTRWRRCNYHFKSITNYHGIHFSKAKYESRHTFECLLDSIPNKYENCHS